MISASQLLPGVAIRYQGNVYRVQAANYYPGQGKMEGVTHTRLKNLETGTFWDFDFHSDAKFEEAP
jgi:translation elongation factor P/translation initiation factor 5A